ncbi:MAG: hypothetical protein JXR96_03670 [Deltaproteobacteria bacterium]|nr:hypothetical protein [Deltaproteobacteria bacterium]
MAMRAWMSSAVIGLAGLLSLSCSGAAPSCDDGEKNGQETGVDCGGPDCQPCLPLDPCLLDRDCTSGVCADGVCREPCCTDSVANGEETDADCGGPDCPACGQGLRCEGGTDCASGVCDSGACAAASCADGVQNQDETGTDCGGGICPTCPDGAECEGDGDCASGVCELGICQAASCEDEVVNGDETDLDCGGPDCPACGDGRSCASGTDCISWVCADGVCAPASCGDEVQNHGETDVDCGGPACPACRDGQACLDDSDCASGVCEQGVCQPPSCADGAINGDESDEDCGGAVCPPCADGLACRIGTDCESGVCFEDRCRPSGSWPWCPGPDAYVGDAAWAWTLRVSEEALYCATFNEMRTLEEEYGGKARLRLVPGDYPVPETNGSWPFVLPICIEMREPGSQPAVVGEGTISANHSSSGGGTTARYTIALPMEDAGGTAWTFQMDVHDQLGSGESVIAGLDGTHPGFESTGYASFSLCQGECWQTDDLWFDSCTFEGYTDNHHQIAFDGGWVDLHLVLGYSMASTEPGIFLWSEGQLDGQGFEQLDYYQLIYNPEHHHFSRDFAVLFDAPIGDFCGLRTEGVEPWPETAPLPVLYATDCDMRPLEERRVTEHLLDRL